MLHLLKQAIHKKKLYVIIKASQLNQNQIHFLLKSNIILGYYKQINKNRSFLVIFINYSFNFKSTIMQMAKTHNKNSNTKNININKLVLNSNFTISNSFMHSKIMSKFR